MLNPNIIICVLIIPTDIFQSVGNHVIFGWGVGWDFYPGFFSLKQYSHAIWDKLGLIIDGIDTNI